MCPRRRSSVAMLVVITLLAGLAVAGRSRLSGPVLFDVVGSHGLHRDDLIVVALWVVGLAICVAAWRRQ
ncbi:hypothetical protein [Nocardioides sp.]|uniref:hypothetical protein n=1 Tax=Nocardioides sp. TaxID=35761 RepID=UPI0039E3C787